MSDTDVMLVALPDVYRLWYEVRDLRNGAIPTAVIDIKNKNDKEPTPTERVVYDWHLNKGLQVFLAHTDLSLSEFNITRWSDKKKVTKDAGEYIQWIKSLKRT